MDLAQHVANMSDRNSSGKQAVWTSAMSSFVLKFMANLVAGGTRTTKGFKEVHHISCAKALNEFFRINLTAIQVSNHIRKWKKKWGRINKLKSLSGAVWDEHTCTIVLDQEHYTGYIKVRLHHMLSSLGGGIVVSILSILPHISYIILFRRTTLVMPTS
jgi:hypothetical protein